MSERPSPCSKLPYFVGGPLPTLNKNRATTREFWLLDAKALTAGADEAELHVDMNRSACVA
jgi:hypothetical protein